MLKIIVNCGPAEPYIARCIASIRAQSLEDWQAYVTIDPCGDRTYEEALRARAGDPRIRIRRNRTRRYTMVNLIRGIRRSGARPEDVIVVLDGDDAFATPDALLTIDDAYRTSGCWMTYGSWVSDLSDSQGMWPAYPDHVGDFRSHPWLATAVRTWKRWLWDLVDDSDFRDAAGNYFCVTEDQAVMFPMLEMSGPLRARHISDVLMIYTRSSPHACCYTRREEMLANEAYVKARPRYPRLVEKPDSAQATLLRRSRRSSLPGIQTLDYSPV